MRVAMIGNRVKPEKFGKLVKDFGSEVVSAYDPSGDTEALAGALDCRKALSFEDAAGSADGVIIVTENAFRAELVIKACEMGKHIFVEKPMCLSVDDAVKIQEAVHKSGIKFFMSDPFVGASAIAAKKVMKGLGTVKEAHISYFAGDEFKTMGEEECAKKAELQGGGVMSDIGGHVLHIAYYLFGMPRSIMAKFEYFNEMDKKYGVEDYARIVADYGDFKCILESSFYGNLSDSVTEIVCENGVIADRGSANHNLDILVNDKRLPDDFFTPPDRHIRYWLRLVEEDITPEQHSTDIRGTCGLCVDDAVKLIQMREAIYASARRQLCSNVVFLKKKSPRRKA